MIAGIKGTVESIGPGWVVIDVSGVSFQVFVPTSTLSNIGVVGQQVKLHTHLHVREDNLTLFGFSSSQEMGLFETLITVKGIGPKLGLALLSAVNVEQLTMAIASGDAVMLTSVPGVGKKTAERIVLELKDKVGANWVLSQDMAGAQGNGDVVAALVSLGYSVSEATHAVSGLPKEPMELEEKIKLALQTFSGQ